MDIQPIEIGRVVEIDGQKIIVETNDNSNDLTYFHDGKIYRGVSVGQFVGIARGPYILVSRVEKEFLTDELSDTDNETYRVKRIKRKLELKLLGYLENNKFYLGIIAFPMIYNKAIMLSEIQVKMIISNETDGKKRFYISVGETVNEKTTVNLNIRTLFNTHIGIFGNTGSGKSNTLAKVYTELFRKNENPLDLSKSRFVFIDFNGEYVNSNVLFSDKKVYNLSTSSSKGDKLPIGKQNFWDIEVLSILLSATEKTQKPFLKNAIDYYLSDEFDINTVDIINGICSSFYNVFNANNSKETNKLLHLIYKELNITISEYGYIKDINQTIPLYTCLWNESQRSYYIGSKYINGQDKDFLLNHRDSLNSILNDKRMIDIINDLSTTTKMKIAIYSYLIYGVSYGAVQYEHISPLLNRLQLRSIIIDKVLDITDEEESNLCTVISLKNCNIEAKKTLPLLFAKNTYNNHKKKNKESLEFTYHLIIDEAHNILSTQSIREESTWKDYRLEVFEEIIKEGRKFGYYITLASQRPADISHTLISQLHNYFLHRLVSEQDIYMINNTINTIDSVSRSSIPLLAPGQCIITGTSFSLPLMVQIDKLQKEFSPNSDNADLEKIWDTIDGMVEDFL